MKYRLLAFPLLFILALASCKEKADNHPLAPGEPVMGEPYAGGIVFYIDNTGTHGLVAALSDEKYSAEWGCENTTVTASGTSRESGPGNTSAILSGCSTAGIAARKCDELNSNGISDWYLPSKDELALIYTNLQANGKGGFTKSYYWSSSEADSAKAWFQFFGSGFQGTYAKSTTFYVRAVRVF